MTNRTAARLAWSLWALAMLFIALGIYFHAANPVISNQPGDTSTRNDPPVLLLLAAVVAIPTVGALVASRRQANPIGWILCGLGLMLSLSDFAGDYALQALLTRPGSLPGGELMAWLAAWGHGPSIVGAFVLVCLLFPDGRPLTPRWRPVVWLAAIITPALGLGALVPGPLADFPFVNNPIAFGGTAAQAVNFLVKAAFILLLATLLAAGVCLILRFRRSRGDEREQLKWVVGGGALVVIIFLSAPIFWCTPGLSGTPLWPTLFVLALLALPLSMGIAILKYRLYAIDLIIRRTLVYGVLSGLLVLAYFGSVVLLQNVLRTLTGQEQSQLVTVVSTLAIAALFNPLRHRVQNLIDRAFYRRKYDAGRVLAAFSATARDEVELNPLIDQLLQAADETVRPEHVSVWLRPADVGQHGRSSPLESQAPLPD